MDLLAQIKPHKKLLIIGGVGVAIVAYFYFRKKSSTAFDPNAVSATLANSNAYQS